MHDLVRSSLAVSLVHCRSHRKPTAESVTRTFRMPNDTSTRQARAKSTNALSGRYMSYIVIHIIGDHVYPPVTNGMLGGITVICTRSVTRKCDVQVMRFQINYGDVIIIRLKE